MANRLIITGHGAYGSGVESTISLIAGNHEGVHFIDFPSGEGSEKLMSKYAHIAKSYPEDSLVFICDLLGGTPFKIAAELSVGKPHMAVVAGCNIGAILDAIMTKASMSVEEVAEGLVSGTQRSVVRFTMSANTVVADGDGL